MANSCIVNEVGVATWVVLYDRVPKCCVVVAVIPARVAKAGDVLTPASVDDRHTGAGAACEGGPIWDPCPGVVRVDEMCVTVDRMSDNLVSKVGLVQAVVPAHLWNATDHRVRDVHNLDPAPHLAIERRRVRDPLPSSFVVDVMRIPARPPNDLASITDRRSSGRSGGWR